MIPWKYILIDEYKKELVRNFKEKRNNCIKLILYSGQSLLLEKKPNVCCTS